MKRLKNLSLNKSGAKKIRLRFLCKRKLKMFNFRRRIRIFFQWVKMVNDRDKKRIETNKKRI